MSTALYHRSNTLGRLTAWGNLALLACLPITWFLPLLKNKAFYVLSSEITLWTSLVELFQTDIFLALVILIFAMVMPLAKCALYAYLWFVTDGKRPGLLKTGSILAKLSMIDVFLFALLILIVKGLSIGTIEPQFGLYAFSSAVLASLGVSVVTDIAVSRSTLNQRTPGVGGSNP